MHLRVIYTFLCSETDVDTAKYAALFKRLEEELKYDNVSDNHIEMVKSGLINATTKKLMGKKICLRLY